METFDTNGLDAANLTALARKREQEWTRSQETPAEPTARELKAQAEAIANRAAIKAAQARADSVLAEYGRQAPKPMSGENALQYRALLLEETRAAMALKPIAYTSARLGDEELAPIEDRIYTAALKNAKDPVDLPRDQIREIVKMDSVGRMVHEFVGGADSFKNVYGAFIGPVQAGVLCNPFTREPLKPGDRECRNPNKR